jgi:hypothetical protein
MKNRPLAAVEGSEKVLERLGSWPDFHDAECMEITLRRSKDEGTIGPTLIARFHLRTFSGSSHTTEAQEEKEESYTLTLKFLGVERLMLEEFNYQNVINGLDLEELKPVRQSAPGIRVTIQPGFGVGGSFNCHQIKVVGLEPFVPPENYW